MKVFYNIFTISHFSIFLGVALPFFSLQYYLLATLVGTKDNTCIVGGYLTWNNILFAVVMSVFLGLLVVNIGILIQRNLHNKARSLTGLSAFGVITSLIATVCPICIISVAALGTVGVVLQFFSNHHWILQLASLISMIIALEKLNNMLRFQCHC